MLQQDEPDDYVVATGESHSVRELVELAFAEARARLAEARRDRPALSAADRGRLRSQGDAGEGARQLGWRPRVSFAELVQHDGGARSSIWRGGSARSKQAGYVEPARGAAADGR